jgi:hypothetical protein
VSQELKTENEKLKQEIEELKARDEIQRKRLVDTIAQRDHALEKASNGAKGKVIDVDDPRMAKFVMQVDAFMRVVDLNGVSGKVQHEKLGDVDLKQAAKAVKDKAAHFTSLFATPER